PNDNTFYLGIYRCGAVWNQLEAAGIPEVKGVWAHEAGGSRFMLTVSIKQLYGGHAKQAGMGASHCHAGAYCNRWTIVVDDDIDPANINDVIWAMCTAVIRAIRWTLSTAAGVRPSILCATTRRTTSAIRGSSSMRAYHSIDNKRSQRLRARAKNW